MNRLTLLFLVILLAFISCGEDKVSEGELAATETTATPAVEATALQPAVQASTKTTGFNYLTDCDNLVVSKLVLSGPNGEGDFAYLQGVCYTNKSYELILVPRSGATPAARFGNPRELLNKAAANNYADYICYAFESPKMESVDQSGTSKIVDIFPINSRIKRFDNATWINLGVDRAEDLAGYNELRWKILHDEMPKYD